MKWYVWLPPEASCICGYRASAASSRSSVPALQAEESVHPKHRGTHRIRLGGYERLHHVGC